MADEHTFAAALVTPETALFSGEATAVVCRTSGGDLMVLAGHTPLVGDVIAGVVRIEREGEPTLAVAVHGGFLQVETAPGVAADVISGSGSDALSTRVTLLAGVAEPVGEIDVARAQAARDAAAQRVAQGAPEGDEAANVELDLAVRALARAELRLEAALVTTT